MWEHGAWIDVDPEELAMFLLGGPLPATGVERVSSMLTVPGGFVQYLRSGLFGECGYAAEDISHLALQVASRTRKDYLEALRKFIVALTLLSKIGWGDNSSQANVEIDLGLYPTLILKTFHDGHVTLLEELQEMPKKTTSKDIYSNASSRVEALGAFVQTVEWRVKDLVAGGVVGSVDRSAASAAKLRPRKESSSRTGLPRRRPA